jgi:DNA-directed RNA polymerase beta' subunit
MQNALVEIHNTLTKKISGKYGIIRQAIMGKSIDYAATAVISAPRFNTDTFKEQLVPYNHIGIPLYLLCSLFFPFFVKFLEDLFYDFEHDTAIQLKGNNYIEVDDIIFDSLSTDNLKKIIQSYISDKTKYVRTMTVKIGDTTLTELIKGRKFQLNLGNREATLTDILFLAANDILKTKHVLSSRYPITGSESIIVNKIKVLTTEKNIKLNLGNTIFSHYPYFPLDKNNNIIHTEIKWLDSVIPNNVFLGGMGGDYDNWNFI